MELALFLVFSAFSITMGILNDKPKTTVILAESDKEQNAIVVKTEKGEVLIDKPNLSVSINSKDEKPKIGKEYSKEEISSSFGEIIKAMPKKPVSILLYFKHGSSDLTEESKEKLNDIPKLVEDRFPCDVNIIGHADRSGSDEVNIKVSLKRAEKIKSWFDEKKLKISKISVESYGENDPLVKTADGVAEPKNRRVEVMIR